jgi:hypothetical protein
MAFLGKVKPLSEILFDSAPNQGEGLHNWLVKGARLCQRHARTPTQAHDLIASTVERRGGEVRSRDIEKAISKAYSTSFSGGGYKLAPRWPDPDLGLIEEITTPKPWSYLNVLYWLSPDWTPDMPDIEPGTTDTIIRRLFPAGSLICPGIVAQSNNTYELNKLKNPHLFQFVVPNPMSKLVGLTQDKLESGRCLDNTGPRRFLVTEFDFKRLNDNGQPTKWVPLIDKWEAAGMTIQDACAAIILHMMEAGPLSMVVYSGGKSLHAWWFCQGESEEPGSKLHKFMSDAVRLGADPATYTRSQFVRMPGAIRPDKGTKQSVHYLDFQYVDKKRSADQ